MNYKILYIFVAITTLFDGCSHAQCELPPIARDGDVVVLSGKLSGRIEFGPPGFGESPEKDIKQEIYLLQMHQRQVEIIDPDGHSNKKFMNEIQVRGNDEQMKSVVGKIVSVRGTIRAAILPSDYTPAVLEFDDFQSICRNP